MFLWYFCAGARQQTGSILLKLSELKEARDALNLSIQKLEKVDSELNTIKGAAAKFVLVSVWTEFMNCLSFIVTLGSVIN